MKRKQKTSENESYDENVEVEPNKIKKHKTEDEVKSKKNFDIKKFRQNLKKGDFYDGKKMFIRI
jgi:hypothetical protein